ncbi:MAG: cytochrome b [Rhodospirillales bacterium]|nr:cytochrome b [Rhodospirillales bacterium]
MPPTLSYTADAMAVPAPRARYDGATIALHWLTAFLIAALWGIGQTRFYVPAALRHDYLSLHMTLGLALGVLMIGRLIWRATAGRHLPPVEDRLMHFAATAMHAALYLLILGTVALGLTKVWAGGSEVFHLFAFPAFAPGNRALGHLLGGWHALAANAIMILAGLHAAAGIFHHLLLRDGVLRRMVPFLKD